MGQLVEASFGDYLLSYGIFTVVSFAASRFAILFPKIKLPLISGYLVAGMICGPYCLGIVQSSQVPHLGFITQFALAFISFSAGAELYLPELRELFRPIAWVTGMMAVFIYSICTAVIASLALEGLLPSMVGQPARCVVGVSLVVGSVMVARSPASAIAIVKELRAKGPFTSLLLGVTVVCDVVVLIMFAISIEIARTSCHPGKSFNIIALAILLLELTLAFAIGYGVGKLLIFYLWVPKFPAQVFILPTGFILFLLSNSISDFTLEHFAYEINLEPLLICIVAGYVATNQSHNRNKFLALNAKAGPYIFIPFFTLTGASLNLGVMVKSLAFASIMAVVRAICMFIGGYSGGRFAGSPTLHNLNLWMTMLTQAGVSLGLALKIALAFPDFGESLATTVVAVIVINQLIGPILTKMAIKKVGEARTAEQAAEDLVGEGQHGVINRVLLVGATADNMGLIVRLLQGRYWVMIVDNDADDLLKMRDALLEHRKAEPMPVLSEHEKEAGESAQVPKSERAAKPSDDKNWVDDTLYPMLGGYFEVREIVKMDAPLIGAAIEAVSADMNPHKVVAAFVATTNDEANYYAAKYILQTLRIQRVVVKLRNALWANRCTLLGAYPVFTYSIDAHVSHQALFTPKNKPFEFLYGTTNANSFGRLTRDYEQRFFLATLPEFMRADYEQLHPGPTGEYISDAVPEEHVNPGTSSALKEELAAKFRQLAKGDPIQFHERDEYLDRINMFSHMEDSEPANMDLHEAEIGSFFSVTAALRSGPATSSAPDNVSLLLGNIDSAAPMATPTTLYPGPPSGVSASAPHPQPQFVPKSSGAVFPMPGVATLTAAPHSSTAPQ